MATNARRISRYTLRCPKSGVELRDVDRLKYIIDPVPPAYAQPRTQAINARPPFVLVGVQQNFLRTAQLKSGNSDWVQGSYLRPFWRVKEAFPWPSNVIGS
jgi:hypothetical protein